MAIKNSGHLKWKILLISYEQAFELGQADGRKLELIYKAIHSITCNNYSGMIRALGWMHWLIEIGWWVRAWSRVQWVASYGYAFAQLQWLGSETQQPRLPSDWRCLAVEVGLIRCRGLPKGIWQFGISHWWGSQAYRWSKVPDYTVKNSGDCDGVVQRAHGGWSSSSKIGGRNADKAGSKVLG